MMSTRSLRCVRYVRMLIVFHPISQRFLYPLEVHKRSAQFSGTALLVDAELSKVVKCMLRNLLSFACCGRTFSNVPRTSCSSVANSTQSLLSARRCVCNDFKSETLNFLQESAVVERISDIVLAYIEPLKEVCSLDYTLRAEITCVWQIFSAFCIQAEYMLSHIKAPKPV